MSSLYNFFEHLCKISLHKSFLPKILSAQEYQHQESLSMYDPNKSSKKTVLDNKYI